MSRSMTCQRAPTCALEPSHAWMAVCAASISLLSAQQHMTHLRVCPREFGIKPQAS